MKKRSKQILTLFILGLVLILLAPYVPDFCFRVLLAAKEKLFDYRYWDIHSVCAYGRHYSLCVGYGLVTEKEG